MLKKLKKWMADNRYTQTELASATRYAQPTISGVLSGKCQPGGELRIQIERVTGLPASGWMTKRRARAGGKTKEDAAR